jgi:hypothetical protein
MPDPLTPAECDLRGMPFMPVDLVRLFDSDIYALSNGDEFKAAFTLWGKAFLQVPAGSLPTDDRILAHLSGAGARWTKVKAMALRGWMECSDGRLHHPVVAEKARAAWKHRLAQRARTEAARAALVAKRQDCLGGNAPPATTPATADDTHVVTSSVTDRVTVSKRQEKGEGQGQGQGIDGRSETTSRAVAASPSPAAIPPPDARATLWTEGLARLRRLTGLPDKAVRGLLGKLCRDALDDCALVASLLHEAEARRIGDPIPWINAALRTRTGERTSLNRAPNRWDALGAEIFPEPNNVMDGCAE